jgi:hypothetical protein
MTTGMSAVCQSSLSRRAAMKPETRGIWTSSTTASGWCRNTACTAPMPSSVAMTSWPSRVSTLVTMRRSVGLSSAITIFAIYLPTNRRTVETRESWSNSLLSRYAEQPRRGRPAGRRPRPGTS